MATRTKEEERLLDEKIARIQKKNEEILRREREIEEDKRLAAKQNAIVQLRSTPSSDSRERTPALRPSKRETLNYDPLEAGDSADIYPKYPENITPRGRGLGRRGRNDRIEDGGPPPDPRSYLADSERDPMPPSREGRGDEFRNNRGIRDEERGSSRGGREFQRGGRRGRGKSDRGRGRDEDAWRAERNRIDEERIRRQKSSDGGWRREWDSAKIEQELDEEKFGLNRSGPNQRSDRWKSNYSPQSNPGGEFEFDGRPSRGDFDNRPSRGDFNSRSNRSDFDSRPSRSDFNSRPNRGDFDNRPSRGDFDNRPGRGDFDSRPSRGDFDRPVRGSRGRVSRGRLDNYDHLDKTVSPPLREPHRSDNSPYSPRHSAEDRGHHYTKKSPPSPQNAFSRHPSEGLVLVRQIPNEIASEKTQFKEEIGIVRTIDNGTPKTILKHPTTSERAVIDVGGTFKILVPNTDSSPESMPFAKTPRRPNHDMRHRHKSQTSYSSQSEDETHSMSPRERGYRGGRHKGLGQSPNKSFNRNDASHHVKTANSKKLGSTETSKPPLPLLKSKRSETNTQENKETEDGEESWEDVTTSGTESMGEEILSVHSSPNHVLSALAVNTSTNENMEDLYTPEDFLIMQRYEEYEEVPEHIADYYSQENAITNVGDDQNIEECVGQNVDNFLSTEQTVEDRISSQIEEHEENITVEEIELHKETQEKIDLEKTLLEIKKDVCDDLKIDENKAIDAEGKLPLEVNKDESNASIDEVKTDETKVEKVLKDSKENITETIPIDMAINEKTDIDVCVEISKNDNIPHLDGKKGTLNADETIEQDNKESNTVTVE